MNIDDLSIILMISTKNVFKFIVEIESGIFDRFLIFFM